MDDPYFPENEPALNEGQKALILCVAVVLVYAGLAWLVVTGRLHILAVGVV